MFDPSYCGPYPKPSGLGADGQPLGVDCDSPMHVIVCNETTEEPPCEPETFIGLITDLAVLAT